MVCMTGSLGYWLLAEHMQAGAPISSPLRVLANFDTCILHCLAQVHLRRAFQPRLQQR